MDSAWESGYIYIYVLPLGHSQYNTLSQSLRQLITYDLWYFADVAVYLLKKEVEKIRLQVLFRL